MYQTNQHYVRNTYTSPDNSYGVDINSDTRGYQ
jgi:hypothetical protein